LRSVTAFSAASVAPSVHRRLERPRITTLESVAWETKRHATIAFHDEAVAASPAGTFCMVWVPGVDEVPMGTGYTDEDGRVTLTIEAKGDCTEAMLALPEGSRIGVRGPYGTGFALPRDPVRVCFVGGGTGIAPMARGAQQAAAAGHDVTVVSGARSRDLLLLHEWLGARAGDGTLRYEPCTDDGTFGFDGTTIARLAALLDTGAGYDYVAACGPERMMVAGVQECEGRGVAVEASLERYMKCAVGICDACTVGPGDRLCVEGPVLGADRLREVPEFGVGHRDAAGIMHAW
jgi:dihydroorotate dehydrogenase electron transfer subunit